MATETSPAPWDLRSGEKWRTGSDDPALAGDHNNEVIVDAKGNVVAYVSGLNDEGGNGSLLAAAPALLDALKACLESFALAHAHKKIAKAADGGIVCACDLARAALKQAGVL